MKKSLILVPLMAALLCACGGNNSGTTSGSTSGSTGSSTTQPVGGAVVYDFSSLTGAKDALDAAGLKSIFDSLASNTIINEVTATEKVFNGNGSGGAHQNENGMLKFGTGKGNGSFTVTLAASITKVTVKCHDFYAKSSDYPTGSNHIVVNGEDKACPYNETGNPEDLVFNVSSTKTLTIESKNTDSSKFGRFTMFKLTLE